MYIKSNRKKLTERRCLKCDRVFRSRGNRICPACRVINEGMAPIAEGFDDDVRGFGFFQVDIGAHENFGFWTVPYKPEG